MNVVRAVRNLIDSSFRDLTFSREKAETIRQKLPLSFWTDETNQRQICSMLYVKAVGAQRRQASRGGVAPINVRTAVDGEFVRGYIDKEKATEEQFQTFLDLLCEQGAALHAQAREFWKYGTEVRGFTLYLPFEAEADD